ncbi:Oidioi.mRNA.OKI2018_I69.chr1.g3365.t2.cds [Oikopleura dioica]|uniref:Oidioi.mRNA.OKI2018_I69.chr1.g3365.t2.cds n=1 Tax=Oikopleura dioica TaxID=34765 RepID=A0ABN7T319_OIKDI|nr:Oidioi.mRNA.OKI2018_I69.chr1.g3365.t2.cds [Oikopleura dioica]
MARRVRNRREIYCYESPWPLFSMGWCQRPTEDGAFRLAVGSFIEEYSNKVKILNLDPNVRTEFEEESTIDHPYPCTKIMWCPPNATTDSGRPDLIATSGDYLRIFRANYNETNPNPRHWEQTHLLNNNNDRDFCAPLTSFDWSPINPRLIGTSSIDTTCTIWEVETGQALASTSGHRSTQTGRVRTQLIAHEQEVYDIAFDRSSQNGFASVGGDGSVRIFDLRHLEHSTIIYESNPMRPLLRLAWNGIDANYIAALGMDVSEIIILDKRVPCIPVARLANHRAAVNGVSWAPHSAHHVCTVGDDKQALIWDIQQMPRAIDPILAYSAGGEINSVQWGALYNDWIAITYNSSTSGFLEILRV